jgi:hypothetical protein
MSIWNLTGTGENAGGRERVFTTGDKCGTAAAY